MARIKFQFYEYPGGARKKTKQTRKRKNLIRQKRDRIGEALGEARQSFVADEYLLFVNMSNMSHASKSEREPKKRERDGGHRSGFTVRTFVVIFDS